MNLHHALVEFEVLNSSQNENLRHKAKSKQDDNRRYTDEKYVKPVKSETGGHEN